MKAAPPGELLRLVEGFLSSYGFNKTRKHFSIEQKARNKKIPWREEIDRKLSDGMPSLVEVFQSWQSQRRTPVGSTSIARKVSDSENSEASSESSGAESDSEIATEVAAVEPVEAAKPSLKRKKNLTSSPVGESSSSEADSDSSSSDPPSPVKKQKITHSKSKTVGKSLPSVKDQGNDSSSSASDSDSSDDSSDEESGSDSTNDSNTKMELDTVKAAKGTIGRGDSKTSTSSSKTLSGDEPAKTSSKRPGSSDDEESETSSSDSDSTSDSDSDDSSSSSGSEEKSQKVATKSSNKGGKVKSNEVAPSPKVDVQNEKLQNKGNTPFSRIPKDTKVDPRFASNKYIPYDYAQRAHEDLIVTKGRGFTKEKNKKKRGSYRGGIIDTSGGKGVKFDD